MSRIKAFLIYMNSDNQKIDRMLQREYQVNIGEYLGKGWQVLKQCFVPMVGFFLLTVIINFALSYVPILGQIVSTIISAPLAAGYTFVVLAILRDQPYTFNDFFKGVSNKYFLQIFLISLVGGLLILLGYIFLLIPGIYLSIAYIFAIQLAVDYDLEFWDALETSRKLVSKKWFSISWFSLVLLAVNVVGLLLFGIGLLVTLPLTICTVIAAYDDIAGNTSKGSSI